MLSQHIWKVVRKVKKNLEILNLDFSATGINLWRGRGKQDEKVIDREGERVMFLNKINKDYTAMLHNMPEVVYGQCGRTLIRYGSLVLRLVLVLFSLAGMQCGLITGMVSVVFPHWFQPLRSTKGNLKVRKAWIFFHSSTETSGITGSWLRLPQEDLLVPAAPGGPSLRDLELVHSPLSFQATRVVGFC